MKTWLPDDGRDVTSAFVGITSPVRELYDEIHARGWTVTSVKVKNDQFVAEAKNPYGEKIEKTGPTEQTALAHVLVALMRQETMRFRARTATWGQTWDDHLAEIAHAYAEAPVYDPKAAGAWKELAEDMAARAQAIQQQIEVEVTDDPHPYKTVEDMYEDVRKKRHILVSRYHASHPLWTIDQVMAYRLVRDVLGHCVAGGDWGWHGENRATAALMPLLSPNCQKALFTESIGQAAYNSYYRAFGPQKIVFLDKQLEKIQGEENKGGHGGVHPSQVIVPGELPDMREQKEASTDQTDPNAGWSSGVEPLPDNAYLWIREQNGLDPLDWLGAKDHAGLLDSGWHKATHPSGEPDLDSQRQAVVNALRAALLAPRKNARWAATHYQHVAPIPATVSDPQRYWDVLETHREHHNQARGLVPASHRAAWEPELQQFRQWVKALNPTLNDAKVDDVARRELFHMLAEEEERITSEDLDGKLSATEIEQAVQKEIQHRLKAMTKGSVNEKTDFPEVTANIMNQPDPGVYGSFLLSHIKPLAAISHHANDLLSAARQDVSNNGGQGHHWRKTLLGLGIPGVGPIQASHSWFLLQPQTSQLGIMNPQMAEILGHRPEDLNDRDYFKWERELAAGRDAAGYGHVPLGQFGSALWDYRMAGPGQHTDHSPLRAVDPQPHDQVDWANRDTIPQNAQWSKPYWWEATQDARNQVAKDWDEGVAKVTPSHEIPFQKIADAFSTAIPFFVHPKTGESILGTGNEPSIMAHIRNVMNVPTEQVWALDPEAGWQR